MARIVGEVSGGGLLVVFMVFLSCGWCRGG
jgi:hypothetical protein